jgi:hypothetical protein
MTGNIPPQVADGPAVATGQWTRSRTGQVTDDPTGDDIDHVTLQSDHGMNVESGRNYSEDVYW